VNKFIFEADPPKTANIPSTEILGVTVILLTCSYDEREFVRVGYYVNNEYSDPTLNDDPPAKPEVEKVRRSILAEKPRVTRFAIKWDSEESAPAEFPPEQPDVDAEEADGAEYGAEEEEEEAEIEEAEGAAKATAPGEDAEMEGMETNGKEVEDDEESETGSVDLDAESSGEDDELEEEEGEGEANGDEMEMDDAAAPQQKSGAPEQQQQNPSADVMVH